MPKINLQYARAGLAQILGTLGTFPCQVRLWHAFSPYGLESAIQQIRADVGPQPAVTLPGAANWTEALLATRVTVSAARILINVVGITEMLLLAGDGSAAPRLSSMTGGRVPADRCEAVMRLLSAGL